MSFKIVDTGLPMPEPDPASDIRDEAPEEERREDREEQEEA
jgi:hypothetical protein